MIGLYLLFLLGIWTVLVAWLSVKIAKRLPVPKWRPLVGIGLFIILLPMVLIDELIGKWQFEQLCQENSTIYIAPDAKGRTVVYQANPPDDVVQGTWVRIRIQKRRYVDATTGETIVSYKNVKARGGWFMRSFFWGDPIIFKGYCQPSNPPVNVEMFKNLGINYIEPPERNNGRAK